MNRKIDKKNKVGRMFHFLSSTISLGICVFRGRGTQGYVFPGRGTQGYVFPGRGTQEYVFPG